MHEFAPDPEHWWLPIALAMRSIIGMKSLINVGIQNKAKDLRPLSPEPLYDFGSVTILALFLSGGLAVVSNKLS